MGVLLATAGSGQVDLAEVQVDHAVEELVVVFHVVVEQHRLDPDGLAKSPTLTGAEVGQVATPQRRLEATSCSQYGDRGHQLRAGGTGTLTGMGPIGWLILAIIVVVVAVLVFVVFRRRRRGGGVIATKGKR